MLLVCTRFPVIYYQTDVKSIAPFARLHPILRGLLSRDDIPFRMMLDRPAGGLRAVDREAVPRDQRGLRRHSRRDRARRHPGARRFGLLKSNEGSIKLAVLVCACPRGWDTQKQRHALDPRPLNALDRGRRRQ